MARRAGGGKPRTDPAVEAMVAGHSAVGRHPLFRPLVGAAVYPGSKMLRADDGIVPRDGWAVIDTDGTVHVHSTRRGSQAEWSWVFAHLWLHLGMGHREPAAVTWAAACDVVVRRFQATLKLGTDPFDGPADLPGGDERTLAERWADTGVPARLRDLGVAGGRPCVRTVVKVAYAFGKPVDYPTAFAIGLSAAVRAAVDVAGGARESLSGAVGPRSPWERARSWFVASYPLLASVMSTLTVVADADLARGWGIWIAAVDATAGELYVNPLANLTDDEWRFVLAHEALHAALCHHARLGGRDKELFNIACDYVINGWLVEMGLGTLPDGGLYDPRFAGASAEHAYDEIAREARRYRKLATLRGPGGDVVHGGLRGGHDPAAGVDLDELLRRGLLQGLDLHVSSGRGLLPAALVEEIRALAHPPLAWDVALARWFEERFPAVERRRSYARPSRRSSATPDIPRPGYVTPDEPVVRRTFGVVLDTSGSMAPELLGRALGAIASYAAAHDVPAARVVFCDAAAYDAGYLAPDEIAGRVRVKGRGGTVLQPGVDLLERAPDFPADGPVLVITDGGCDVLRVRRDHAYLIPAGATLPFTPRGPVFRVTGS
jgi:predicted metal-dependent peptidase